MAGIGNGIKMITDEAKLKYIKDGGNYCPYCGSDDIEAGQIQFDDDLNANVTCLTCWRTWKEFYKVSDVV